MRARYDEELNTVSNELIIICSLVEDSLEEIINIIDGRLETKLNMIFENRKEIKNKIINLENLCIELIVKEQPVASDLRLIHTAIKIVYDLEKMIDQIYNILRLIVDNNLELNYKSNILQIGKEVKYMLASCVDAFIRKDVGSAKRVIQIDDKVDKLYSKFKEMILVDASNNKDQIKNFIDYLMMAKYFEKIADFTEHISKSFVYYISGERT